MRALIHDLLGIHDEVSDAAARTHIGRAILRLTNLHINQPPRDALTLAEKELYKAGKKIACIKSVRERLGTGLKYTKALVEYQMNNGEHPGPPI